MDILMVCIFACWTLLVFFFICYAVTTKRIIKGQEKEIEDLQRIISKKNNQLRVDKAVPERFKR